MYKAFISYSHAADGKLAPALQSGLHRFARPWFRLRAIRVFRDETNLSVSPGLWPEVEKALSASEHFVLLASPQAAASKWVKREVEYWLKNRSTQKLLIVLTDGKLTWDTRAGDFDWSKTNSLPENLVNAFAEEPLYLDLQWARTSEDLSLNNPAFRDKIADLAATLHERPKDELIGEDVRQYQKTRRLAWSAIVSLIVLTVSSIGAAYIAFQQRNLAIRQRQIAIARQLAAQAEVTRTQEAKLLIRSTLLAVEAMRRSPSLEANRALRMALQLLPKFVTSVRHGEAVNTVAISPDGKFLATGGEDNSARLWIFPQGEERARIQDGGRVVAFSPNGRYLVIAGNNPLVRVIRAFDGQEHIRLRHGGSVFAVAFSPNGNLLATASDDRKARVWELASGRLLATIRHDDRVRTINFSPDGRFLASGGYDNTARVWDIKGNRELSRVQHEPASASFPLRPGSRDGGVHAVAFSPDGRYLATAGQDRTARIWAAGLGALGCPQRIPAVPPERDSVH